MAYLNPTWSLKAPTDQSNTRTAGRIVEAVANHLSAIGVLRVVLRVAMLALVTVAISGIIHALSYPAGSGSSDTASLVDSLASGDATSSSVPTYLERHLGYAPVPVHGNLGDPTGGCSTPGQFSPPSFVDACRTHDLGYDLLRAAEAEGGRLAASARFDIDMRFYVDMLDSCETASCRAAATTFYSAVTANSIRQGYRVPGEEPALPWLGVGLLVVGSALIVPARRHTA